jgi:DNA-binding transcriptional MerR regulator
MDGATYTSDVVAEAVGVPYRTLMRWVEEGLIIPAVHPKKHRVPVQWSEKNLREVDILAQLRKCNLSLQQIRGIMTYLRKLGDNPFSSGEFIVLLGPDGSPQELVKIRNGGEALALMKKHRGQLMLPLWSPAQGQSR